MKWASRIWNRIAHGQPSLNEMDLFYGKIVFERLHPGRAGEWESLPREIRERFAVMAINDFEAWHEEAMKRPHKELP